MKLGTGGDIPAERVIKGDSMRIAIPSSGKTLDSSVDQRFGRCRYFIIVETDNDRIISEKYIENEAAYERGGAGIQAAENIGKQNVNAVIADSIGPNAFRVLNALNIEIYNATGVIRDVVRDFIDKKLSRIQAPSGSFKGFGHGRRNR